MMREEAIYARQSVDKKDSVSIETQIDQCKTFSDSNAPIIFKDKGFSGKNTERPALQKLIAEIIAGRISKVYVYKLDRISRNITDFYQLYEVMKKYNTEFVSVNEHFDTTSPMGRAMMGIIAVFAQMERETIQQRVKDNYYYRIQDGRWAGGPAPYGFKNARTELNVPTLEPIETEIEVVKNVYALYNGTAHMSLTAIGSWLYEEGYRTRKGGLFTSTTLARMLQNPVYVAADQELYNFFQTRKIQFLNEKEDWNGVTSACIVAKKNGNQFIRKYEDMKEQTIYLSNIKPVIPSHLYIDVQDRLLKNEQFKRANSPSALEELAGKLKCAKCGHAIKAYSQSTTSRPYLSCHGKTVLRLCDLSFKGVNFYDLQENVGTEIQKYLDSTHLKKQQKLEENFILANEKSDLESQLNNLISLAAVGGMTADVLQKAIEERQSKIYEIELQIQKNSVAADYLNLNLLTNAELNFYHGSNGEIEYSALLTEQKKEIIKILVDKILVQENGKFEIIWNM